MKKLFLWILKSAGPSASGLFFSWSVFAVICAAGSNGNILKDNTEMKKGRGNIYIADLTVRNNTQGISPSQESTRIESKTSPENHDNALCRKSQKASVTPSEHWGTEQSTNPVIPPRTPTMIS